MPSKSYYQGSKKAEFIQRLKEEVGGNPFFSGVKSDLTLKVMREKSSVADGCAIYLVNNEYVLHLSPSEYPDEAVKAGNRAREIKAKLGSCGDPVLVPVAEGRVLGRSYTISAKCLPLRSAGALGMLDRIKASRALLPWLRGIAGLSEKASPAFVEQCRANASRLSACERFSEPLKKAIASYQERLGNFGMRTIPMHGDLWLGNVMRLGSQIVVIDWGGGLLEGYPIFDLIRAAISLKMSKSKIRSEIELHASSMGTEVNDLDLYLISCFAHIFSNLGEFPEGKFVDMAERTWKKFKEAIG